MFFVIKGAKKDSIKILLLNRRKKLNSQSDSNEDAMN